MKEKNTDRKIYGFLDYEEGQYPFILFENVLHILPSTSEQLKQFQNNQLDEMIKDMNQSNIEKKWINNKFIFGKTHEGKNLLLLTNGEKSIDNGIIQYEIQAYHESQMKNNIKEIFIRSEEIDCFYNPARVFQSKIVFNAKNVSEKVTVDIDNSKNKEVFLGKYNDQDTDIHMYVGVDYKLKSMNSEPLIANSFLHLEFMEEKDFDSVLTIIYHISNAFKYLNNRKNIYFSEIDTISYNNEKRLTGDIFIKNKGQIETNDKKKKRFIKYEYIQNLLTEIVKNVIDQRLYIKHLCNNILERSTLDVNRIIMIFSAFEREYSNIYAGNTLRSEEYYKKKDEIISLLEDKKSECGNARERKYVKNFIRSISNSDHGLSDWIKMALNDCLPYIDVFIQYLYSNDIEEHIDRISGRMSKMRNDIAHGNLFFEIYPENVDDIRIMEILIYVMRLKFIKMDRYNIQMAISELFGFNIAIKKTT